MPKILRIALIKQCTDDVSLVPVVDEERLTLLGNKVLLVAQCDTLPLNFI
jgi:hypothetical protein